MNLQSLREQTTEKRPKNICRESKHLSSAIADSDRRSRSLPQTTLALRQGLYSGRLLAQAHSGDFDKVTDA